MKSRSSWHCVCGQYSGAIAHRICAACEFSSGKGWLVNRMATDQKTVAERQWQKPKLAPKPQQPCDHGLFSDEAMQLDLVEMLQDPTNGE